MRRNYVNRLAEWKGRKKRLPIILHGARQVGKTHAMRDFGNLHFAQTHYFNFEKSPDLASIFAGEMSPQRILRQLSLVNQKEIDPKDSLLLLDEIQLCERALTSLKYFAEEMPEMAIISAGSLLGVLVHRERSAFPVGKVEIHSMHPMSFDEFLGAMGNAALAIEIREHFKEKRALATALHTKALEFFTEYLLVGGMPAVVKSYAANQSVFDARQIQWHIINAYIADMAKYCSASEAVKVRTAYESIVAQLAKENHKFQYKLIKKGASASHFGQALDWLFSSGLAIRCNRIEQPMQPMAASADLSAFKVYMGDTGLLTAHANLAGTIQATTISDNFRGAIYENAVAQALRASDRAIYYWESASIAEVDFITQIDNAIIPIEVKAVDHVRSRSLAVYRDKYKNKITYRISAKNFGDENGIISIPHYAAWCI